MTNRIAAFIKTSESILGGSVAFLDFDGEARFADIMSATLAVSGTTVCAGWISARICVVRSRNRSCASW